MTECPHTAGFRRVEPVEAHRLACDPRTLILDVRRPEAFGGKPQGLPGAIPLVLSPQAQRIPDADRSRPVLIYCLCSGEASSTRAALWLAQAGYTNIAVLQGGMPAWERAGFELQTIASEPPPELVWVALDGRALDDQPMMAERVFLGCGDKPARRDIAVVFVDMVNSTGLVQRHTPERVLALFQTFMGIVVDTTVRHCGDVRDFEGDGAMLYFAGVGEALPAVFDLRDALNRHRTAVDPDLPQARFSVTTGPVIIGYLGSRMRRSIAFVGPCVNAAARILRLARPGAIVITDEVAEHGQELAPDLVRQFSPMARPQYLKGWDEPVVVLSSP